MSNERVTRIMQKLVDIFPEQRYCQIMCNALTFYSTQTAGHQTFDIFYVSDDCLVAALWAYYNDACNPA